TVLLRAAERTGAAWNPLGGGTARVSTGSAPDCHRTRHSDNRMRRAGQVAAVSSAARRVAASGQRVRPRPTVESSADGAAHRLATVLVCARSLRDRAGRRDISLETPGFARPCDRAAHHWLFCFYVRAGVLETALLHTSDAVTDRTVLASCAGRAQAAHRMAHRCARWPRRRVDSGVAEARGTNDMGSAGRLGDPDSRSGVRHVFT